MIQRNCNPTIVFAVLPRLDGDSSDEQRAHLPFIYAVERKRGRGWWATR